MEQADPLGGGDVGEGLCSSPSVAVSVASESSLSLLRAGKTRWADRHDSWRTRSMHRRSVLPLCAYTDELQCR